MRQRYYGNSRNINLRNHSNGDSDEDKDQHRLFSNPQQRRRRRKICRSPTYGRYSWATFSFGVIGFCLFQSLIFFLIDYVGIFSNDDDAIGYDDRASQSVFGWPKLLLSMWHYFTTASPLYHLFSPGFQQQDHRPILIVGGSDGSGTRAIVDTLRQLGALVVADDPESFDFHAVGLFQHQGWPGLINAVINVTHTADFEWEDLIRLSSQGHADNIRTEIMSLMRLLRSKYDLSKRNFRRAYEQRLEKEGLYVPVKGLSEHRRDNKQHKGRPFNELRAAALGKQPTMFPAFANSISFVIKAPVSMLILPLFCKFYGKFYVGEHIKFLHVIRE
jgi:hypothetical protein